MADDPEPKPKPESLVYFPPPRKREEQPVYRRPGPVAPEPVNEPRPSKPQVVVSRPDPPKPEPASGEAKKAARKPSAPPAAPYSLGMVAADMEGTRDTAFTWLFYRHPRVVGAALFLLNGILFIRAVSADRSSLRAAMWLGFALVHKSVYYNITAGAALGGLWLLVFGIAVDEKRLIADWWKVGIIITVILSAGFGAKIAQLSAGLF